MALDDLRVYWEKVFGAGSFLLDDEQPERRADMDLLIGVPENLPGIAALAKQGKIAAVERSDQGFALDLFTSGKQRTAVLRAADRLGLQYAVYGFAEQFLGVRFVHPLLDLQPEKPPMPRGPLGAQPVRRVPAHRHRLAHRRPPRPRRPEAGAAARRRLLGAGIRHDGARHRTRRRLVLRQKRAHRGTAPVPKLSTKGFFD